MTRAETEEKKADELAAIYAQVFLSTEAGKRVLADLKTKFPTDRARFDLANPEPLKAAIVDGQCTVINEIHNALLRGSLQLGIQYP